MQQTSTIVRHVGEGPRTVGVPADPCILVIFGASGDLTKRLLLPALFNLDCDGLLSNNFAIVGVARDEMTSEQFRDRLSADIRTFATRAEFDADRWQNFARRIYYTPGSFDDSAAYERMSKLLSEVDGKHGTRANHLFYFATPPSLFGLISSKLAQAGAVSGSGWRRVIVEKPFGTDLPSAIQLNKDLNAYWKEEQIYRIDHYLGKETVQNLLAFRFSNGIFEPLWNKQHVDHIQFTVAETVGVERRAAYYDKAGVLRDMVQNHMLQMLTYLCMEPPSSFKAEAIRNEKSKVMDAVRIMRPEDVLRDTVRGQYGAGKQPDGTPVIGYREDPDVPAGSVTETYVAMKLHIDNWRWEGVPIYLRSGKGLWKRGTEILVQFKKAPEVIFRYTPEIARLEANQLIFHIQPAQGIELRIHAKSPGPAMHLQKVNMRFDYSDSFVASRGTGYEILIYNCMQGDSTLFSRADLVESAWRIAQPMLDTWPKHPPANFPNYQLGSWGPKEGFDLIERDGRAWLEVINDSVLAKVPLFNGTNKVFLNSLAMMLEPKVFGPGELILKEGDVGEEMYVVVRGQVEVLDGSMNVVKLMEAGDYFGETALLTRQTRTASIRARNHCDLFVLEKCEFDRVLADFPQFAQTIKKASMERYDDLIVPREAGHAGKAS